MIVVTVFLSILSQMEFHLVQNRKENSHHDHIPFILKGNGNIKYIFLGVLFFPLGIMPAALEYTWLISQMDMARSDWAKKLQRTSLGIMGT